MRKIMIDVDQAGEITRIVVFSGERIQVLKISRDLDDIIDRAMRVFNPPKKTLWEL